MGLGDAEGSCCGLRRQSEAGSSGIAVSEARVNLPLLSVRGWSVAIPAPTIDARIHGLEEATLAGPPLTPLATAEIRTRLPPDTLHSGERERLFRFAVNRPAGNVCRGYV